MPIVVDPPSFTGVVYNQSPFDISFGSTFSNYTKTIQFTDSSPAVLAATSGNRFVSTTGYTGTGNVGTMIVDAISTNPRTVTTYAGANTPGFVDGIASNARFNYPTGMVTDSNGTSYIVDTFNCMIRSIDSNGIVSRYAGTGGSGVIDGNRYAASFAIPRDIDLLSNTTFYITDANNNVGCVRKMSNNSVTTLSQTYPYSYISTPPFSPNFYGIAVDPTSNVYVCDSNNNQVVKIDSLGNTLPIVSGPGSSDGTLGQAGSLTLTFPYELCGTSNLFLIASNLSSIYSPVVDTGLVFQDVVRDSAGTWIASVGAGAPYPLYVSTDATFPTWSAPGVIYGSSLLSGNGVATNNTGLYVVTGSPVFGGTTSILYSTDSVQWFGSTNDTASIMSGFAIACGASRFIVTGTPGTASLMYAPTSNLTTWTAVDGTALGEGQTIATDGNSNWIAVGDSDARVSTNNGNTWATIPQLISRFGSQLNISQVVYANSVWIAVGSNIIARSTDRTTWTDIPQTIISNISSVVYNPSNNTWLARGLNNGTTPTYAQSTNNGLTWSAASALRESGTALNRKLLFLNKTLSVQSVVPGTATTTGPFAIRSDPSGVIYFGDASHKIRKISNGTVSTYAGTGTFGSNDGPIASATFGNIVDIRFDPTDGSMFVLENTPSRVRKISNGVVSTYAGTGAYASTNGAALTEAAFANVQKFTVTTSNVLVAESGCNKIRSVNPPVASVRPGGSVPSGYTIVDTATIPISVGPRIDASTNNGDILQLYKYEPFSYGFRLQSGVPAGDTLSYSGSSTELFQFLSNTNSRTISFSSTAGPTFSSSNALSLLITDLSGTVPMEAISNTVYLNPGRFFPPANNSVYTFYRNEPIDPVLFQATIPLATPVSFPALPQGLSFTRIASNAFYLTGTPLVQQLSSNYRIIGNGFSNSAQVVSVLANIRVLGERVVMDVSGSTTIQGIALDTSISPVLVTSRCPPYPVLASNVKYTWSPSLPDGIRFTDICGTPVSSGFVVNDLSYSIQLRGAPTSTALQTTPSPYTVTLTATRQTTPAISNAVPFTFAFQETVVFDPFTITPLYVGAAVQSSSTSNSFSAQTKFSTTSVPITSIFSPNLRSDLSLSFVYATQRASLIGTPTTSGSGTYTIRAINSNNVSVDTTASISVSNDQVFFSVPTADICYNFIQSRPLSSAKDGYYPYPIQFRASTLSGCNVTMTASGLGNGITLSNVSNGLYQLEGQPIDQQLDTTLSVTAICPATGASKTATATYGVSFDLLTVYPLPRGGDVEIYDLTQLFTFIQNAPITPIQLVATALSGRPVVRYLPGPDIPLGLTMSPSGLISGAPTASTSETDFSVYGITGYVNPPPEISYRYKTIADSVLLYTDQLTYTFPAGTSVYVPIKGIAYSGAHVGSFELNPALINIGLSIDPVTGVITGIPALMFPTRPLAVSAYAGTKQGTLNGTVTFGFTYTTFTIEPPSGGPTITSPSQTSFVYYQYMTINPIVFSATGTGTVYVLLNPSDLPLGLQWNPVTQKITGSPMRLGETSVTVYFRDNTGTRSRVLRFNVLVPRIVRQQDGAGAFTSLLRQYVEVNAAQNARDSRVYPSQERALGEFMSPDAPDVTSPDACKKC